MKSERWRSGDTDSSEKFSCKEKERQRAIARGELGLRKDLFLRLDRLEHA